MIGQDGLFLREILTSAHVDCRYVAVSDDVPSGHAMIQVSPAGENCIVLYGGANQALEDALLDQVFAEAQAGDVLLLQNEISRMEEIIRRGKAAGMFLVFNPAPMSDEVATYPLDLIDVLVLNETEAAALFASGWKGRAEQLLLLTKGARGACCQSGDGQNLLCEVPAAAVEKVVDTTAAGDTFLGYFLAARLRHATLEESLREASLASAYCISRVGAAPSIPWHEQILA